MITNTILIFIIIYQTQHTLAIRGICAYEIMLGHIGIATGNLFLYPNRKAGILIVGVFFLLSGYGLMYSLKNKEDYLKQFYWRFLDIFSPAYLIYIIMFLIQIPNKTNTSLKEGINYFAYPNWYVLKY